MLNEGFRNIYRDPSLMLWPALVITLVCAALALLGNALRDAYEPAAPQVRPRSRGRKSASASGVPAGRREASGSPRGLLSVEGLSIEYSSPNAGSRRVVDAVSLHVASSEIVGLVGESGSGKTQTALSVLGLLPSAADVVDGTIHFDGRELTSLSRRDRRAILGTGIAYIPQEPQANLDPSVRVGDQLIEPLRSRLKMSKAQARSRVTELLTKVGIADPARVMAAYPHQISGGMAQRVLIAGAVACEPALLIADEPTTALDVTVQAEVLNLLRELQAEFSMGVLVVTHNFGVVADLCDRVYVMRSGSIVEDNATQALFDAPQHEYTRTLLGAILSEEMSRAQLDAAAGSAR
jgi:peptide/nickel transport system permease protein